MYIDEKCLGCDCYDTDTGCQMPLMDRYYACDLYDHDEEFWGGQENGKKECNGSIE